MAAQDWGQYRYLRVRIRTVGSANQAFTLALGSKEWSDTTDADGTWKTVDFDLACPENTASTTDAQDSRWPLTSSTGTPTTSGDLWGVDSVSEVHFKSLVNGKTYEIDYIELRRSSYYRVSSLTPFENWVDAYPDVGAVHVEFEPGVFSDADGRWNDGGYTIKNVETSGVPAYTERTLTNFISDIGTYQGMTATAAGAFPDSYHTNSRPLAFLGGGGSIRDHSAETWTSYLDFPVTAATTLQAQALWDAVKGYPAIGYGCFTGAAHPAFSATESAKALPLAFSKVLRGSAKGLVFKDTDVPFPGATVVAYESSGGASVGSATSQTNGSYETGLDHGRGNRSIVTELRVTPTPYLSATDSWQNRRRERTSFRRAPVTQESPSQDVHQDGQHIRAYVEGGNIIVGKRDNRQPRAWADTDTGIAGSNPSIRWANPNKSAALLLVYDDGANVYYRTSTDTGASWSGATTVGAGKFGTVVIVPNGERFVFYNNANAFCKSYDASGNSLRAGAYVADADANTRIGADFLTKPTGEQAIVLTVTQSGDIHRIELTGDGFTVVSDVYVDTADLGEHARSLDNGEFRYFTSGTDLIASVKDSIGTTLRSSTALTVDSGTGAGVAVNAESSGAQEISVLYLSGGTLIEGVSSDGETFS